MYTPSNDDLGRLPWVLCGIALAMLAVLLAITLRPKLRPRDTVSSQPLTAIPAWEPGPGWVSSVPPVRSPGEAIRIPIYPPWSEDHARRLFTPSELEKVDEYCGKLYQPNVKFMLPFPEHPDQQIEFVVNSRSMREDDEPLATKPLLRILVAGDSHTDGVCKNSESFSNLTEQALRQKAKAESAQQGQSFDPRSIEVLNAGKGAHSFFNYLGVLERHLELLPDVFVLTVYGGNDFHEVLLVWYYYHGERKRPPGSMTYPDEIKAAMEIKTAALNQAMYSVKYFDVYPEQMQLALDVAVEVCGQIQALCRERGIRLLVLYLPPRHEVEPELPDFNLRKLVRALKLTPEALAKAAQLGSQFLTRLSEIGIESVDLRPTFLQAKESLYWNADWHINLAGHQIVARALYKALTSRP